MAPTYQLAQKYSGNANITIVFVGLCFMQTMLIVMLMYAVAAVNDELDVLLLQRSMGFTPVAFVYFATVITVLIYIFLLIPSQILLRFTVLKTTDFSVMLVFFFLTTFANHFQLICFIFIG